MSSAEHFSLITGVSVLMNSWSLQMQEKSVSAQPVEPMLERAGPCYRAEVSVGRARYLGERNESRTAHEGRSERSCAATRERLIIASNTKKQKWWCMMPGARTWIKSIARSEIGDQETSEYTEQMTFYLQQR